MKIRYLLLVSFVLIQNLSAQNILIRGKVLDGSTNEPLIYASIFIPEKNIGTITNTEGGFSIEIPDTSCSLIISYVGYKTGKIYPMNLKGDILIKLLPLNYLLQEISVYSKQKNDAAVSATNLQNRQIKIFAGMTKDALRAIQLLPGVSTNNETSAKINVRGGSTDENLVLINSVEVNEPYHIKEIQSTSVGIFNIDMVNKIDFSAGGFSAEYGNALSSIMRIDYSSGDQYNYKGKVDLSLIDLSMMYQGPINKSSSFMIGVRRSYLDYLLHLVDVPSSIYVAYYDIQGQVDYALSSFSKLKLNFIYSKDDGDEAPTIENKSSNSYWTINKKSVLARQSITDYNSAVTNYSDALLSANFTNTLSKNLISETILSYYNEYNQANTGYKRNTIYSFKDSPQYWANYSDVRNRIEELVIKTYSLKQSFLYQVSPYVSLKGGMAYRNINYINDKNFNEAERQVSNTVKYPDSTVINYPPNAANNDTTHLDTSSFMLEGYLQQTWQLSDDFILNAGLRLDYLDINKRTKISPRLSLTYKVYDELTLRAAWGIFYQPPNFNQLKSSDASYGNTNFQKAIHYILGIEKSFNSNFSLKIEGYYKSYADLIPVNRQSSGGLLYPTKENIAVGYAAGFDLQFTGQVSDFNFWISYGYLAAREKSLADNLGYYPRYTDQTHTLSAVATYDVWPGFSFNLRAFYGSGFAFTPSYTVWDSRNGIYKWATSTKNSEHYSPYERVDVRVTKEFNLLGNPLQIYIDVMNIFNRKNIFYLRYTYDEAGQPKISEQTLYGLIPTLGISYSF